MSNKNDWRLRRFIDETGKRYFRLVVLRPASNPKGAGRVWLCLCDCGKETLVKGPYLRNGNTTSCGCRGLETLSEGRVTHGKSHLSEYKLWEAALDRCRNPRNKAWEDYGGRGITFSSVFLDFDVFYAELGPRPFSKAVLDRINNDKGYEPGNIRWVTRSESNMNCRPKGSGRKARKKAEAKQMLNALGR